MMTPTTPSDTRWRSIATASLTLSAGSGLLAGSASAVAPTSNPSTPDAALLVAAWWLAAALLAWWTLSMASWLATMPSSSHRDSPPNASAQTGAADRGRRFDWRARLERVAAPGTRKLAEGMLAAGFVVLPACSPSLDASAPTLVFVEELQSPTTNSTLLSDVAPPTSTSSTSTTSISTAPTSASTTVASSTSTPSTVRTSPTDLVSEPDTQPTSATTDLINNEPEPSVEPSPVDAPHRPSDTSPSATYEVVAGDNLWSIAASHVSARLDRVATASEVAPYWRDLVAANRPHLTSGLPDLIHPGERILLPHLQR